MKVILSFTLTAALILTVVSLVLFQQSGMSLIQLHQEVYAHDSESSQEGAGVSRVMEEEGWSWFNAVGVIDVAGMLNQTSDSYMNVPDEDKHNGIDTFGLPDQGIFLSGVYIPVQSEVKNETLSTLDNYLEYRIRMNQMIDYLTITQDDLEHE